MSSVRFVIRPLPTPSRRTGGNRRVRIGIISRRVLNRLVRMPPRRPSLLKRLVSLPPRIPVGGPPGPRRIRCGGNVDRGPPPELRSELELPREILGGPIERGGPIESRDLSPPPTPPPPRPRLLLRLSNRSLEPPPPPDDEW